MPYKALCVRGHLPDAKMVKRKQMTTLGMSHIVTDIFYHNIAVE